MISFEAGPVDSLTHATSLLDGGATRVGVSIGPESSVETWAAMSTSRTRGRLGVMGRPSAELVSLVNALSPRPAWLDLDMRGQDPTVIQTVIANCEVPVHLRCLPLDYDEDPAWVRAAMSALPIRRGDAYVVSLLHSLEKPLAWLEHESGTHPDDVTMRDVHGLASKQNVVLTAPWNSQDRVPWFVEQLPEHTRLFAYLRGACVSRASYPMEISVTQALAVLKSLIAVR